MKAARAIVHGEPLPDSLKQSVIRFKLGFGGQVTILPGAYDCVYNPFLRWAYNTVFPKIAGWPVDEERGEPPSHSLREAFSESNESRSKRSCNRVFGIADGLMPSAIPEEMYL